MKEIWKEIKGYEGLYQISNYGRVKALKKVVSHKTKGKKTIPECIKKLNIGTNKYYIVMLSSEGVSTTKTVHRLVAIAFLPNPENKPEVNHKDGNKLNNNHDNLEWNTKSENRFHAYRTGLQSAPYSQLGKIGVLCHNSKKIVQVCGDGTEFNYDSITIASEITGVDRGLISKCAKGNTPVAGGYKWKYA